MRRVVCVIKCVFWIVISHLALLQLDLLCFPGHLLCMPEISEVIKLLIHKRRDNAAQTLNGPKVILYFHNIFFSIPIKATIASIMAFNSVFSVATERL